jgi:predicted RNA-binding Zn ribbon-like protein
MDSVWRVPHENKPAPGELLLVQAFVNTWDGEHRTDVLLDPTPAAGWLANAWLWDGPGLPDLHELDQARRLREALRLLLLSHNGGPVPAPGELQPLHAMSATALCVDIGPGGTVTLQATQGGRGGRLETQLARLLLVVRDAQLLGTWPRLKACRDPQCQWAFYDRSHSQQGAWCEMRVCGNRAKNRRFRQRPEPAA